MSEQGGIKEETFRYMYLVSKNMLTNMVEDVVANMAKKDANTSQPKQQQQQTNIVHCNSADKKKKKKKKKTTRKRRPTAAAATAAPALAMGKPVASLPNQPTIAQSAVANKNISTDAVQEIAQPLPAIAAQVAKAAQKRRYKEPDIVVSPASPKVKKRRSESIKSEYDDANDRQSPSRFPEIPIGNTPSKRRDWLNLDTK